jgi:steroid 5-alpha reductase family enzyme
VSKAIPLPVKIITWIFTSSLMFYISFCAWIVISSPQLNATIWPALLIMIFGLVLETAADEQKQRAKAADKDSWCETGLYRRIRHPNFLGEMIFHAGLYWAVISAATQWDMYILGAFGSVWLVILMSTEAVTYDRNHAQHHGESERYAAWLARTGLLWPKL